MQRVDAANQTRRILFVGEDTSLAEQFRQAGGAADGWMVDWARTAKEALSFLAAEAVSAVVAQSRLPDFSGGEFLDAVMFNQPQVTRILRFRLIASRENLRGMGQTHHLLREPCDASTLLRLLQRMDAMQKRLPNPALPALLAKMRHLPSPPHLYFQVVNEMASDGASVERVGELIARDPAATAKLLQLANSAAFGLQVRITQPLEAVNYLGFEMTKALLLVAHSFSFFEEIPAVRIFLEQFWSHSLNVGRCARQIAETETADQEVAGQAFSAGLLHDVGKLLFAANLPQEFGEILALAQLQRLHPWEIETQILGASHAELGAYMLGIWNLPVAFVEAVAWHHCPTRGSNHLSTFAPLTAVHVANVLDHEPRAESAHALKPEVDLAYLQSLGCAGRLVDWRQSCQGFEEAA